MRRHQRAWAKSRWMRVVIALVVLAGVDVDGVRAGSRDGSASLRGRRPLIWTATIRACASRRCGRWRAPAIPTPSGTSRKLLTDPVEDISGRGDRHAAQLLPARHPDEAQARRRRVRGRSKGSRAEAAFELGPFVLLPRAVPDALKRRPRRRDARRLGAAPRARRRGRSARSCRRRPAPTPSRRSPPTCATRRRRSGVAAARVAGAVRAALARRRAGRGDERSATRTCSSRRCARSATSARSARHARCANSSTSTTARPRRARPRSTGWRASPARQSLGRSSPRRRSMTPTCGARPFEGIGAARRRRGDRARSRRRRPASAIAERAAGARLRAERATAARASAIWSRRLGDTRDAELAMAYLVELGRPVVPGARRTRSNDPGRARPRAHRPGARL